METDITPIFKNDAPPIAEPERSEAPSFQDPPQEEEFTPMNEIQDEESYHQSMMPPQPQPQQQPYYWPPMQPPYHPQAPAPSPAQWDPFKNISTSTWVILIIAFALGFFIGKFK